jgi:TubC N-terminal docking domain
VQGLGRVEKLLAELRALGVVLSIDGDGRLAYDAPAGVIGDDLLGRMRAERVGLLELLASEHTGPDYLAPMPGVICPWCSSDKHLLEHPEGLRCDQCGRDAFRFEGGSIVRADYVELIEVDWPI